MGNAEKLIQRKPHGLCCTDGGTEVERKSLEMVKEGSPHDKRHSAETQDSHNHSAVLLAERELDCISVPRCSSALLGYCHEQDNANQGPAKQVL